MRIVVAVVGIDLQAAQDALLGVGIHAREGVIEDEDGRPPQQRARDGGALFLSARERHAAFANHRLEALRKFLKFASDVRGLCGLEQLFSGRIRNTKREIFADGFAEQECLLGNDPHVVPKHLERIVARRSAVNEQRLFRRFVKPRDQVDQGGFSRTGWSDDGQARSGEECVSEMFWRTGVSP